MSTTQVPILPPPPNSKLLRQQSTFYEEDKELLFSGSTEQAVELLIARPCTRLDFPVDGEPFLVHLAKSGDYSKLRLFTAHLKRNGMSSVVQCQSSKGETLLHLLFSQELSEDTENLDFLFETIFLLLPQADLLAVDDDGDAIIEFALHKQWDCFKTLRQNILHKLALDGAAKNIEIKGEPLLVFLARETELYSEELLHELIDSEIGHVVEVFGIPENEELEDDLFINTGSPKLVTVFDFQTLERMHVRRSSNPKVKSGDMVDIPEVIEEESVHSKVKAAVATMRGNTLLEDKRGYEALKVEEQETSSPSQLRKFVTRTKHAIESVRLEHIRKKVERKLLGRLPSVSEDPLLFNEVVPISDYRRRSSGFSSTSSGVGILPIRELKGVELENVKKKILIFRKYQQQKKSTEKRAKEVSETRELCRKALKSRRASLHPNSPLATSPNSAPMSFEPTASPHYSDTFSTEGEVKKEVAQWKQAFSKIRTANAQKKAGWDPTLFLIEKKLSEEHKKEKQAAQKEWEEAKKLVHEQLTSFQGKHRNLAETSAMGGYQTAISRMTTNLESFHMEGELEQASEVMQQVGQLAQLILEGRDVIKGWDVKSIDAAINSASAGLGIVLGAGEVAGGMVTLVGQGTVKAVAEGIANGCGVVNDIQSSINEALHMVIDICHLVKEFYEGEPALGKLESIGAVDILKKGAGFAKQLLRIIRNLLKATKGILELVGHSTVGLAEAIPGLGILFNIMSITERAIYLADNAFSYSELCEMKDRLKDSLVTDPVLRVMFDKSEARKTSITEMEYFTQTAPTLRRSQRLYQESDDDILEARRYELVRELKSVCGKRILKNACDIAFDLGGILGEGLKLGGVTAEAGIAVGASISISRAGITALNHLKRLYHTHQDDEKSPKAKHLRRCRLMETFFVLTLSFLEQDFSDESQAMKHAAQYQELRQYFYAMGLKPKDIIGKELDDNLLKFVYDVLKKREP
ncbi:hypothetical protein [Parashewanella tropica]|uniref:hypothetical protein n=1 Tax=Parashewanella tropica TaxID=2547970 RepID=UPI0010594B08|nr:hypothetical protein [Parashewanella tropica]